MVVRPQGKGNTYSLLVRVQTCTANMEVSVVAPQEAVNQYTLRSSYTLLHTPKGLHILSQKHLFIHVHCCSIHNTHKLETA